MVSIVEDAREMSGELVRLRRRLHREPEVGLQLPRTQDSVLAELDGLGLEVRTGGQCTSVTAVLRGSAQSQRTVMLRADMDALPVHERTGLDYASTNGAMHACGHDLHTAMLTGAARLLSQHRDRLAGDVVLMFQPGEEGYDGAGTMIDEGVLDAAGRRADTAYAMHVFSSAAPHGKFVSRPGAALSASDELKVVVRGAGGHGSAPHRAHDPVPAMAEMITGLQTMVGRRFDIFDPVVVTVGTVRAGTAHNVIPDTAEFGATVRSFSADARARVRALTEELLHGIAAAHGVTVDVELAEGYPVTVTDAAETGFVAATIAELFGDTRYEELANPLGGSEDFSRVLQHVPGGFVGLSAVPPEADPRTAPYNHSPLAVYDDSVLAEGAALYAELAVRRLMLHE